ncbi:NF038122 family metalloprotease [Caulobacter sp. KR2-114]|uniref:NF038122 family metalloprotease n=2 Tax=Caulobacter sp. KR2-114 TaxID=3400912 RepID=UPI003C0EB011
MQINITWDASAANAPAGFKAAVQAAVNYLEQTLAAPITVNIAFGWGEVGGQSLGAGSIGASLSSGIDLNYADFRSALWANATTADALAAAKALPASDPTHGGTFFIATAEAKALGLVDPTDSQIDGYVGLDSTTAFTFDPNNRAASGLVDAIGALEHEITEVLGRTSFLGYQPGDGSSVYGALDLFRYTAPGVLNPSSATGSFSVDGQTLLLPFDNPVNGGDSGDWSQTVTGDAFDAFGGPNEADLISATDLRLMDVLGYHPNRNTPPTTPTPAGGAGSGLTVSQDTTLAQGQTAYVTSGPAISISGGPSFTNAGTIEVITVNNGDVPVGILDNSGNFGVPTVKNAATGVIYVESTTAAGVAFGYQGGYPSAPFENAGLIQVVSLQGAAVGAKNEASETFTNDATGKVIVWSAYEADGINMGGGLINAGLIDVTGAHALGVRGGGLNNSGTIRATNTGGWGSIAVSIEPSSGQFQYVNSGVIQGDYAFYVDPSDISPYFAPPITITNSGTIVGVTVLGIGTAQIHNTGMIAGAIFYGDQNSTYDGAGGKQIGGIYLGRATNTAHLGNDGETVFGGGGADTITGGSGDDVIVIARGANVIDGGGGFNTLSFADSAAGVLVDLGAGTASAGGTDTISNIQAVIASDFTSTLKAGSTAARLVGGAAYDTLIGGAGGDTLVAGTGGAVMTGNGGADTFVYDAGDHQVVITDFKSGVDHIQVYDYAHAASVQQQGADTLVTLGSGDTILLKGVTASALTGGDIVYSAGPPPLTSTLPPAPPVFGTTAVTVDSALTIHADETLNLAITPTNQFALIDTDTPSSNFSVQLNSIDNFGVVDITASGTVDAAGILVDPTTLKGSAIFINEAGASFLVTGVQRTARGVYGQDASPDVTNAGLFQVKATGSLFSAYGVDTWDTNFKFNNTASGVFKVQSDGAAYGLYLNNGGTIENDGQFTVDGFGATGIYIDGAEGHTITNEGVITVTGSGASGVVVAGLYSMTTTLNNSGTITASDAITEVLDGNSANQAPLLVINNSGQVNGDIRFGAGDDQLHNTGKIAGAVWFGDGVITYDGGGGTLTGPIYLGAGTNKVTLGADGETVVTSAKGGTSTLTGGAGDDAFFTGAGTNAIDGGGGVNTLSFAAAGGGVTVDLGAGTATGGGVSDSFSHIQQVVGSRFGDTLKAGATSATLISGAGSSTLIGGAAADVLVAGAGGGTMTGGGGADTFEFAAGDHQLVVTDFGANNDQDVLKVFGYAQAQSIVAQGADTLITLSATDSILLKNTAPSALTGANLVFSTGTPPSGPTIPSSLPPPVGGTTVSFIAAYKVQAGQTVAISADVGFDDNGQQSASGFPDLHSLDNAGSITVTSANAIGLSCRGGGPSSGAVFTTEAGASLTVVATNGEADGVRALSGIVDVVNKGTWNITGTGYAFAVAGGGYPWNFLNAASGVIHVSGGGAAQGLSAQGGGLLENDGVLTVHSNSGSAIGFQIVSFLSAGGKTASIVNKGVLTVSTDNASALDDGIRVVGLGPYGAQVIDNSGTITAARAIVEADPVSQGPNGYPLQIINSGTINGDIVLGTASGTVSSTGKIVGNIYAYDASENIDLRNGVFQGDIFIQSGVAASYTATDTIFTGAANTTVHVQKAGYGANLKLSVTGGGGQVAIQFDEASTAASWSLNNGVWTVNAGTDGTLTLTGVQTLVFTDKTIPLGIQAHAPPPSDFNGDGRSDALFLGAGGTLATWQLNDAAIASGGGTLGSPGSGWRYVGSGDFNGDGRADVLFANAAGSLATWQLNGSAIIAGGGSLGSPGAGWSEVGIGDFNGDGKSDVLFQSAAGMLATWDLNGTSIVGGGNLGSPGASWAVKAVADFDGDGKADILFENAAGQYAVWTMHDTTIAQSAQLGSPGSGWSFAGTGDFNGDGKADMLFENASGQYASWDLNGGSIVGGGNIGNPGSAWTLVQIGDFNGDGKSDLMFRNTDGTLATWDLNDTAIVGGGTVGNPGSAWTPMGINHGQGFADLVFANSNGTWATWMINGGQIVGGGTLGTPGSQATQVLGDFNGDGSRDVAFQGANGSVSTWLTDGAHVIGGTSLGNPGAGWTLVASGDFNGDGQSDLLFRNASGQLATWDLHGNAIVGGGALGSPGSSYVFEGVGDLNGDGKADILFRNTTTGTYAAWLMNDTQIVSGGDIGNPGGSWSFKALGDLNGDGKADMLFEDASGEYASWDLSGTQIIGGGDIGAPHGTWSFAGLMDLNGDGRADILFQDASGNLASWTLNDNHITGGATFGAPGAGWHLIG